jgi:hypothetical protein
VTSGTRDTRGKRIQYRVVSFPFTVSLQRSEPIPSSGQSGKRLRFYGAIVRQGYNFTGCWCVTLHST